jgi:hypothetical protein
VELRGGGRWRGEGQVEIGCVNGPGAVKDEREAWTEGPERRRTPVVAGTWGHRQAHVYMGVTVLTKSRHRSSKSSEGWRTWRSGG